MGQRILPWPVDYVQAIVGAAQLEALYSSVDHIYLELDMSGMRSAFDLANLRKLNLSIQNTSQFAVVGPQVSRAPKVTALSYVIQMDLLGSDLARDQVNNMACAISLSQVPNLRSFHFILMDTFLQVLFLGYYHFSLASQSLEELGIYVRIRSHLMCRSSLWV